MIGIWYFGTTQNVCDRFDWAGNIFKCGEWCGSVVEKIGSGLFYISEVKQDRAVVEIKPVDNTLCTIFTML